MFTDIVDSTAVTARSESAGLALRDRHRELVRTQVDRCRGRFVEAPGDESLSTFESAVDAVHAALAIQLELGGDPELQVRIGLHLGETMFRGDEVFGDGVNIAARVRALAEPGQILATSDVAHAVQNQSRVKTSPRGERRLKGVDRPISIHAITGTAAEPNVRGTGPKSAPITAIAVLPFDDLSPDGDQRWLASGITEDLIESLSRIRELRVIARTSSAKAKASAADVRSIGEQLQVGSIVEGSARRLGDQIRVTAQLILVADESHLWSGRYDEPLDDVFRVQTRIAREIAEAIRHKLGIEELSWVSASRYSPKDVRAYEHYQRGVELQWSTYTREALEASEKQYLKALDIEPDYTMAQSLLAWNHWHFWLYGHDRTEKRLTDARALADRVLESGGSASAGAHELLAEMSLSEGDYSGARARLESAIVAAPRHSGLRVVHARVLAIARRMEEALVQARRAAELDPLDGYRRQVEGLIHLYLRDYDAAVESLERALELDPHRGFVASGLAGAYHFQGRDQEALEAFLREPYFARDSQLQLAARRGFAKGGWTELHRALIIEMSARPGRRPPHPVLYARAGDADGMLDSLDRLLSERRDAMFLRDPSFDPYRSDPRFQDLLRRIGFPES
jgi:TolB-like protein/Flp pilus assembly protein TadD